jgi:ABC-2 type transport system ATP-binding protein
MIAVKNLTRRYGRVAALDGVTFEVGRGEIVGLLGPNGAGKTTTLRILSCYLPASGGEVRIGGADVFEESMEVRRKVGYLPENVPLYTDMRVREYLRFRGKLKGVYGGRLRSRVDAVIQQCDLTGEASTVIGRLSKGFRQRVGLADCLLHEPECLILDEPTIGLDPNQIRHIRELIRSLAPAHTILISTHILSEVEVICGRVLILDRGRIAASDTPEALVGLMQGDEHITAEMQGPAGEVAAAIGALEGVRQPLCTPDGDWCRVTLLGKRRQHVRERIFDLACARGWRLRELTVQRRNLEDVFAALTEGFGADTADAEPPVEIDVTATVEGGEVSHA